jgi:DNA end-binding protein Ku
MAKRLVKDMSGDWSPDDYQDSFTDKIMQLVEQKAQQGKIAAVEKVPGEEGRRSADVIDLTELLKRSLGGKPATAAKKTKAAPAKAAPSRTAKPAAKKTTKTSKAS